MEEVDPTSPSSLHESGRAHRKDRVHHTVTACVRCRQRKTRCDAALPQCEPCERSHSHCEYFDSVKNKVVPRTYITSLQDKLRRLQKELKELDVQDDYVPDARTMAKMPGLVKFEENQNERFLGPSSGIAITRFVIDFAKQNAGKTSVKELVTDKTTLEVKTRNANESAIPTSMVYAQISSIPAPALPGRALADQLVNIYMVKAQYMLPLLHEPTFRAQLDLCYNGHADSATNFQVRMVIAISMQKLDKQYAGLADSYYLAALPFLVDSLRTKDIVSLQCLVLIAQYSLLTPTRTASYWIVGIATKLCQDLGICDEGTIIKPAFGLFSAIELDMRRRLYWIVLSMEYGLSHSLGRPSAFGVTVDNINVGFFQLCHDRFITADGILPEAQPVMQKCIAIHFLKMRLLQAEIRRTLYLKKRDSPTTDQDPWFQLMLGKIDYWTQNTPKNDEGSGLNPAWFEGRKNTMIVFLYRPSPQIPEPSVQAATRCFGAAVFNIVLHKKQVKDGLVDVTWIFTQSIFMALNTLLWSISYPLVRAQHSESEVRQHVQAALEAIDLCADRWPGVASARRIYNNLIEGCLAAYITTPLMEHPPTRFRDDSSSSRSQITYNSPGSTDVTSSTGIPSPQSNSSGPQQPAPSSHTTVIDSQVPQSPNVPIVLMRSHSSMEHLSSRLQGSADVATEVNMPLPSWNSVSMEDFYPTPSLDSQMSLDQVPWLAQYGSRFQQPQPFTGSTSTQIQSLTEQDQLELMASLEQSNLPDVSSLASNAATFYSHNFP